MHPSVHGTVNDGAFGATDSKKTLTVKGRCDFGIVSGLNNYAGSPEVEDLGTGNTITKD